MAQEKADGKSAFLTLKLKADSGYSSDETHRIDAKQWADILLICADHEGRKLIAAAPELLEALNLWIAYDDQDEADFGTAHPMLHYAKAIEATRAAIAKARAQ